MPNEGKNILTTYGGTLVLQRAALVNVGDWIPYTFLKRARGGIIRNLCNNSLNGVSQPGSAHSKQMRRHRRRRGKQGRLREAPAA